MRIGILGGTFNPIHIGHMHIADVALNAFKLDKVLFVPTGDPYMKDKTELECAKDRVMLIEEALSRRTRKFELCTVDVEREKPTYAVDTVMDIRIMYPGANLYYIVGTDTYNELPNWYKYNDLIEQIQFIVVTRPGQEKRELLDQEKDKIHFVDDAIPLDISSTKIREALYYNTPCRDMLPNCVYDIIKTCKMYKKYYKGYIKTEHDTIEFCAPVNMSLLELLLQKKIPYVVGLSKISIHGCEFSSICLPCALKDLEVRDGTVITITTD